MAVLAYFLKCLCIKAETFSSRSGGDICQQCTFGTEEMILIRFFLTW